MKSENFKLYKASAGTGKTYTAFQIVYRLLKSRLKRKILYLADRNILVDQSISQDFQPLEKTIHKINFAKDDPTTITSHEVYFSLYQQLVGNEDEDSDVSGEDVSSRLGKLFKKDFLILLLLMSVTVVLQRRIVIGEKS
jgi:type I restriction enzyme R subunit